MSDLLSTAQAAERAGMTTSTFRTAATRERRSGNDMRADESLWPDSRSPLYSAAAVEQFLARRRHPKRDRPVDSRTPWTALTAAHLGAAVNIRRTRSTGMPARDLALLSGFSEEEMTAVEQGDREITAVELARIADALDVSPGLIYEIARGRAQQEHTDTSNPDGDTA